jgi:hypothetical protein
MTTHQTERKSSTARRRGDSQLAAWMSKMGTAENRISRSVQLVRRGLDCSSISPCKPRRLRRESLPNRVNLLSKPLFLGRFQTWCWFSFWDLVLCLVKLSFVSKSRMNIYLSIYDKMRRYTHRLAIYFRNLTPSSGEIAILNTPHSPTDFWSNSTKAETKSHVGSTDPDFQVSLWGRGVQSAAWTAEIAAYGGFHWQHGSRPVRMCESTRTWRLVVWFRPWVWMRKRKGSMRRKMRRRCDSEASDYAVATDSMEKLILLCDVDDWWKWQFDICINMILEAFRILDYWFCQLYS